MTGTQSPQESAGSPVAIEQRALDLLVSLATVVPASSAPTVSDVGSAWLVDAMRTRAMVLARSVELTVENATATGTALDEAIHILLQWMVEATSVRIIGAGRARLAAAIPANRLAHGGARVFVQDDMIPMPHTIRGGGIIAASASGRTESVLQILSTVRRDAPHITVLGIASSTAAEFAGYCDCFIGIKEAEGPPGGLSALADIGEHVISQVLDSLVVAAGRLGGFDDRAWRLGHENLGPTGPYDARSDTVDLLFSDLP